MSPQHITTIITFVFRSKLKLTCSKAMDEYDELGIVNYHWQTRTVSEIGM